METRCRGHLSGNDARRRCRHDDDRDGRRRAPDPRSSRFGKRPATRVIRRAQMQPARARHARQQIFHLVGEDSPVAQDEVLVPVGHVRDVEQRHVRLLGRAVALARVAAATRGHRVHPRVASAARRRNDVVARQVAVHEPAAAIGAHLPVAREQHRVREPRRVRQRPSRAALDREDRLGREPRTRAVALPSAAELANDRAERPRDHLLRVVRDRFLQLHPRLGQAGHVDGQDERVHARL